MPERGVKFVKPELPKWEWKASEHPRLTMNDPAYPGDGTRHDRHERRKMVVVMRDAMKLEAKRVARRLARDAKNKAEELRLSGN